MAQEVKGSVRASFASSSRAPLQDQHLCHGAVSHHHQADRRSAVTSNGQDIDNYWISVPTPEPPLNYEDLGTSTDHHEHHCYNVPPQAHQSFTDGLEVDSLGMPVPGFHRGGTRPAVTPNHQSQSNISFACLSGISQLPNLAPSEQDCRKFTSDPNANTANVMFSGKYSNICIPENDWYQVSTPDELPRVSNTHTVRNPDIQSSTSLTRATLLKTKSSGRLAMRGLSPEIFACLTTHIDHQRHHSDAPPMPGNNDYDSFDAASMLAPCSNTWNVETTVSSFEDVSTGSLVNHSQNTYSDGQARPRQTKRIHETDMGDQDRIPRRRGPFQDQQTRESTALTKLPRQCIRCRRLRTRVSFFKYVHLDLSVTCFSL